MFLIFFLIPFSCILLFATTISCRDSYDPALLKEGDIIFQETRSPQAKGIKLASHSRYTHVGIIFKSKQRLYVLEAVQPVKITRLKRFIKRGVNGHFVVKRINNYDAVMTQDAIGKMKKFGKTFIGKNYDIYFGWSNKRIYCSELVWKLYKNITGLEIGEVERLGDFDLSHAYVKRLLKKRYGKKVPLNEPVISPAAMFDSDELFTVFEEN
ncbi:MAG: YiiX family permuted papain-like enzyme [bacterium]|nr:YiiX family permuted papain-like enzyme [bacterium]